MEDEDDRPCDTEPIKEYSLTTIMVVVMAVLVGGLFLISTIIPFAMAWSKYLTNYFGL